MHPFFVACLVVSLPWFRWDPGGYGWVILLAWIAAAAAQAWFGLRARALHRRVQELRALAHRGEWKAVASAARPSLGAAIVAASSLALIPAAAWLSVRWAMRDLAWDFTFDDRSRVIRWAIERVDWLNVSASMAPLAGAIAALAWGSFVADALCFRGLQRAAAIALQPRAPSWSQPFRSFERCDDRVFAWLEAPGPVRGHLVLSGLLLVATGVTPLCIGVHECLARIVDTLNCRGGGDRTRCVYERLDASYGLLESLTMAGSIGVLASSLMMGVVLAAPYARRRRCGEVASTRGRLWTAGICLGLSVLMIAASRPYVAENAMALPLYGTDQSSPRSAFIGLADNQPGPDDVPDAPALDVGVRTMDGIAHASAEELIEVLVKKRELWSSLFPDRRYPGVILLQCRRETTAQQLADAATTVSRAGYSTAVLVSARHVRQARPVLGDIELENWSGIRLVIGDERSDATLSHSDFQSCAEVMRAAGSLRRDGKRVRLE